MRIESSHGVGESIGRNLKFIGGSGGSLGLGTALTRVGAPLGKCGVEVSGHCFGEGLGGALDLPGGIGRAFHHVTALTRVGTPLGKCGVARSGNGLDRDGTQSGKGNGGELHFEIEEATKTEVEI